MKRRAVLLVQKRLVNPPMRALLRAGRAPRDYGLLETIGRRSGHARRTPVGGALEGDTFWIVAEHGRSAAYVRNEANPRVRIKIRGRWFAGTAHVLPDDDPRERQRLMSRGHPGRALNAAVVRVVGTDLLTVRIDLDR